MREFSYVGRIVCLGVLVATLGWSQSSYTASVRGTITDPSGSAVPSAKVALTETERNVQHNVLTDEAGRYFLTALPPRKYSLSVEAAGFKKIEISVVAREEQPPHFQTILAGGEK